MITNIKSKARERCQFTGSVIITNNVRLTNMPVLRALQGRIRTYHFRPSTSELVAMLRHLAETEDHPEVGLEERREICEFIVSECEHSQQQLDLRLLKHAISDYIQWKRGEVKVHWRQLVVSSMQDHFSPAQALTREEQKHQEQDQIADLIEEAWRSGGSKETVVDGWMDGHRQGEDGLLRPPQGACPRSGNGGTRPYRTSGPPPPMCRPSTRRSSISTS